MKTVLYEFLVHTTHSYFEDPHELMQLTTYADSEATARANIRWDLWDIEERGYEVHKVTLLHEEVINVRLDQEAP